jgi:L-alanine-DL-glutamate epimerase-like enolase superfamily enzyme
VVKIKMGVEEPASEIARLTALALRAGRMRLRLDANGAWGFEEACRILDRLAGLPIESLEEPLRIPTRAGCMRFRSEQAFRWRGTKAWRACLRIWTFPGWT